MTDTKQEGNTKNCFTCKKEMVCVAVKGQPNPKGGNWPDRLVWQTDGSAHYGFDGQKPFCKFMDNSPQDSLAKTFPAGDKLDISKIEVAGMEELMTQSEDGAQRMLIILKAVTLQCNSAGVTHPATIGMIFNQVCQTHR